MKVKEVVEKMYSINDGTRPLIESVMVPEIVEAFKDWVKNTNNSGVLIGGLALSYYVKPRYTIDIDVLFLQENDIPNEVNGFKKIRGHSFQHNKTHVEIEVLSADFLNIPNDFVNQIIKTSIETDGIKIASKSGLVALKLFRGNLQDQADIEQLVKSKNVDITPFKQWLTDKQIQMFKKIYNIS